MCQRSELKIAGGEGRDLTDGVAVDGAAVIGYEFWDGLLFGKIGTVQIIRLAACLASARQLERNFGGGKGATGSGWYSLSS